MTTQAPNPAFGTTLPPSAPYNHTSSEPIQNFTATGRPFNPSKLDKSSGSATLNSTEAMGLDGAINLLPRRYTDNSLIDIPVLPPSAIQPTSPTTPPQSPTYSIYSTTPLVSNDPITEVPTSSGGLKFWKTRKPSFSSTPKKEKRKSKQVDFVMKKVTRGDYLKYYAKDEQGKYIGTEAPAEDCILRDEGDLQRYRGQHGQAAVWRNGM